MKSPSTDGSVQKKTETRTITYRNEDFNVPFQFYVCKDTGEQFTDEDMDVANINQVYNQYRVKYGMLFPEEIKRIREQYGLSAGKMDEILGLDNHLYGNYEAGEVPSVSDGKLIQSAKKPKEFKRLLKSGKTEMKADEVKEITKKISHVTSLRKSIHDLEETKILGSRKPCINNGYRIPSMKKVNNMVLYFSQSLQANKTKLNKLLFYADFSHFKKTGFSVSGLTYKAIQMGPVPKNHDLLFDDCVKKNLVSIRYNNFGRFLGEQCVASADADFEKGLFAETELNTLDVVAKFFKNDTIKQIVQKSHEEEGWKRNIKGFHIISYEYGFDLKYPVTDEIPTD